MKTREVYIRLRLAVLVWSLMLYSLSACVHPGTNMAPGSDRYTRHNTLPNHRPGVPHTRHNTRPSTLERHQAKNEFEKFQAQAKASQKPWYRCKEKILTVVLIVLLLGGIFPLGIWSVTHMNKGGRDDIKSNVGNQTGSTVAPKTKQPESTTRIPTRLTFADSLEKKIHQWKQNPIMELNTTHLDSTITGDKRNALEDASKALFNNFSKDKIITLLDLGVNIQASDDHGINLLGLAIKDGDLEALDFLSENFTWNTNLRDKYGNTAIHHLMEVSCTADYKPDYIRKKCNNGYKFGNTQAERTLIEKKLALLTEKAKIDPCLRNTFDKMASCYAKTDDIKQIAEKAESRCKVENKDKCKPKQKNKK